MRYMPRVLHTVCVSLRIVVNLLMVRIMQLNNNIICNYVIRHVRVIKNVVDSFGSSGYVYTVPAYTFGWILL